MKILNIYIGEQVLIKYYVIKAFNIARNPKYDGYIKEVLLRDCWQFFDKYSKLLTPYWNTISNTIDPLFGQNIFFDSQYLRPIEKGFLSLLSLIIVKPPVTI